MADVRAPGSTGGCTIVLEMKRSTEQPADHGRPDRAAFRDRGFTVAGCVPPPHRGQCSSPPTTCREGRTVNGGG